MNPSPYGQNRTDIEPLPRPQILKTERVAHNDWFMKDQLALQKAKSEHRVREARRVMKGKGPFVGSVSNARAFAITA